MSVVSGVVIISGLSNPRECYEGIHNWLVFRDWPNLARVEGHASGNKHPQCYVEVGGFNGFEEDEFKKFVQTLPWSFGVTVIVQSESSYHWVWTRQSDYL